MLFSSNRVKTGFIDRGFVLQAGFPAAAFITHNMPTHPMPALMDLAIGSCFNINF
jgi:hypothetical protein